MTKAEILKREILSQYKSVRQFAIEMQIPYSTLVTALDRGIEGMAYGTVIKMCDKLIFLQLYIIIHQFQDFLTPCLI